jgi:metallo-beta-lactamase family protein
MQLEFLGATQTVTGSRYLLHSGAARVLVDCGLYQGVKSLRLRNRRPVPFAPEDLDAVLLTHAHLDHSGFLPALYRQGYRGPVYCSKGTDALCRVLLPDAGYLQEEDARFANKHRFSKHHPAEPLYTQEDAEQVLKQFRQVDFEEDFAPAEGIDARLLPVGHILGAGMLRLDDGTRSILFSGDVGRPDDPIMYPPASIPPVDYVVTESTYGDRSHEDVDVEQELAEVVNRCIDRGGILLIPAFAVGRAQLILYLLARLRAAGRIPAVPVSLNSPMAIKTTEIFGRLHRMHRLSREQCEQIDAMTRYVRSVEESIELTRSRYPSIIVSASGMASGGRVLHHLKGLLGDHRSTILFAGFQAPGTRGASLVDGAPSVKIHGHYYEVKAEIAHFDHLSAHADGDELLAWLGTLDRTPRHCWITHGEPAPADTLRRRIQDELGWPASVPEYRDRVEL